MEHKEKEISPIREFFPFYFSFHDALRELEDADRLTMYDSITKYGFYGVEPELKTAIVRACWKLIKPILEKSQRNYVNGSKGGAPKGSRNNSNGRRGKSEETNRELTENLPRTNQKLSNKDKDIDKEKEKDNDNESIVSGKPKPRTTEKMKKPQLDEVISY